MQSRPRPEYATKFRCIGKDCEDNCCRAWEVSIDKLTYQKYQAIPELRVLLDEYFVRSNNAVDNNYAVVKHNLSCQCPLLSPQGLCGIHEKYGPEYLSVTCSTYPRSPIKIDGVMEYPLSLSCPEAARLVLLDAQLLPQDGSDTGHRTYAGLLTMPDHTVAEGSDALRFFWEIREFSISLVRDRSY
jgi:lysine-N-methylase